MDIKNKRFAIECVRHRIETIEELKARLNQWDLRGEPFDVTDAFLNVIVTLENFSDAMEEELKELSK